MSYDFVCEYYKDFCTQLVHSNHFYRPDSSFFFFGDFGKSFVAQGPVEIHDKLKQTFWLDLRPKPIGYTISIVKKERRVVPEGGLGADVQEVSFLISGIIKPIFVSEDIDLCNPNRRRFLQTLLIAPLYGGALYYIKSTSFIFTGPCDGHHGPCRSLTLHDKLNENLAKSNSRSEINGQEVQSHHLSSFSNLEIDRIEKENSKLNFSKINDSLIKEKSKNSLEMSIELPIIVNDIFENEKQIRNSNTFAEALRLGQFVSTPLEQNQNNGLRFSRLPVNRKLQNHQNQLQSIIIIGNQNVPEQTPETTVYVSAIPKNFEKDQLLLLFGEYGKVISIKIVERLDIMFAFVYFESKSSVDNLLNAVGNTSTLQTNGVTLKVFRYKMKKNPNY